MALGAPHAIRNEQAVCLKSPTGAHHWVIPSPTGKSAVGVCKHCKQERTMLNTLYNVERSFNHNVKKAVVENDE